MFPSFPFRKLWLGPALLVVGMVLLSLALPKTEPTLDPLGAQLHLVDHLERLETHYKEKAESVVRRFTDQPYSIDLSLELDTSYISTTTFLPGNSVLVASEEKHETTDQGKEYNNTVRSQEWKASGTWTESSNATPRVKKISCYVRVPLAAGIDEDHLFMSLRYALGIDRSREDNLHLSLR